MQKSLNQLENLLGEFLRKKETHHQNNGAIFHSIISGCHRNINQFQAKCKDKFTTYSVEEIDFQVIVENWQHTDDLDFLIQSKEVYLEDLEKNNLPNQDKQNEKENENENEKKNQQEDQNQKDNDNQLDNQDQNKEDIQKNDEENKENLDNVENKEIPKNKDIEQDEENQKINQDQEIQDKNEKEINENKDTDSKKDNEKIPEPDYITPQSDQILYKRKKIPKLYLNSKYFKIELIRSNFTDLFTLRFQEIREDGQMQLSITLEDEEISSYILSYSELIEKLQQDHSCQIELKSSSEYIPTIKVRIDVIDYKQSVLQNCFLYLQDKKQGILMIQQIVYEKEEEQQKCQLKLKLGDNIVTTEFQEWQKEEKFVNSWKTNLSVNIKFNEKVEEEQQQQEINKEELDQKKEEDQQSNENQQEKNEEEGGHNKEEEGDDKKKEEGEENNKEEEGNDKKEKEEGDDKKEKDGEDNKQEEEGGDKNKEEEVGDDKKRGDKKEEGGDDNRQEQSGNQEELNENNNNEEDNGNEKEEGQRSDYIFEENLVINVIGEDQSIKEAMTIEMKDSVVMGEVKEVVYKEVKVYYTIK